MCRGQGQRNVAVWHSIERNHRVHSGRKCQRGTVFRDYVTERKTYLNSQVQAERERTRVSSLPVIQWTWSSSTQVSYQKCFCPSCFSSWQWLTAFCDSNPMEPSSWSSFCHLCKTAWPSETFPSQSSAFHTWRLAQTPRDGVGGGEKYSDILVIWIVFLDVQERYLG